MPNKLTQEEIDRRVRDGLSVTFTFPTEDARDTFCLHMADGGGEQHAAESHEMHGDDNNPIGFDYSRCFPAWGWKEGEPVFIDVYSYKRGS